MPPVCLSFKYIGLPLPILTRRYNRSVSALGYRHTIVWYQKCFKNPTKVTEFSKLVES